MPTIEDVPVGLISVGQSDSDWPRQQTLDELLARVREVEAESRRHAEAEARLQAEVQRLRTSSGVVQQEQGAAPAVHPVIAQVMLSIAVSRCIVG